MAEPAGQPPPQDQRQQGQGGIGQSLTGIIRMAVFWYFAMKFFSPKKPVEPSQLISNLFQKGEHLVRRTLDADLQTAMTFLTDLKFPFIDVVDFWGCLSVASGHRFLTFQHV